MKLTDFYAEFGVKADIVTVKEFAKAIGDIPFTTASAIAALAGLDIGFLALTNRVLDMGVGFNTFHAETGLSIKNLQQWEHVAVQAGLSAETASQSIKGIQASIARAYMGNPGALLGFNWLKVNWTSQDPSRIMMNLYKRYQDLRTAKEKAIFAQGLGMIGVPSSMMAAFATPPDKFKQRFGDPVIDERKVERLMDLKAAIENLTTTFIYNFADILDRNLPAFTKTMTDFTNALNSAMPTLIKLADGLAILTSVFAKRLGEIPFTKGSATNIAMDVLDFGKKHASIIGGINRVLDDMSVIFRGPIDYGNILGAAGPAHNDNRLSFVQHNYGMPGTPEDAQKHAANEFIRASKMLNRQGY